MKNEAGKAMDFQNFNNMLQNMNNPMNMGGMGAAGI